MKSKVFTFGPFELNTAQQELRRQGTRLRLPASRFRLLLLFIHRKGELLTRDQIAASLWDDALSVDVASGINTAVNQLRTQLGDDPVSPKYIETVIGSGYRFVARVTEVEMADAQVADAVVEEPSFEPATIVEQRTPQIAAAAPTPATRSKRAWALAGVVLVIGISILYFILRPAPVSQAALAPDLELSPVTDTGDIRVADISPDGNYLAQVRVIDGKETLWIKQLASGRAMQLAAMGESDCPGLTFSPDGNYVYFVLKQPMDATGELYRVPFLGGDSEKVLTGISGAPAISPDGLHLAFVRSTLVTHGEDSIVTASIDGSRERVLASYKAPGVHFNRVTWTQDGTGLVYPVLSTLTFLPLDGGSPQSLPRGDWASIDDLWRLPSSRDLVVVGERLGSSRPQVFSVSSDGNEVHEITHDLSYYTTVRSTADGHQLLAVQNRILSAIEVYKLNSGTKTQSASTGNQNHEGISGLAWTPQGSIVYGSDSYRRSEIHITDASGSNPRTIASRDGPVDDLSDPVVSPDGASIYLVHWTRNDGANIWKMDISGANEKQLTFGKQDSHPSISPDGKWLVYATVDGDRSVLMKMPGDGGQPVKLTNDSADYPAISPDGQWIACTQISSTHEHVDLSIVPIAGGPPAKVFPLPETASPPPLVWTPDGKAISFINDLKGVSNIWQQPFAGGAPASLTHFTSGRIFNFNWSRDGRLAVSRGSQTTDAILIKNFRDTAR